MPDERSAGAVIWRNDAGHRLYLLLQYRAGHWEFAKGHVEPGESTEDTIRRECREETGIVELDLEPGFEATIRYRYDRRGEARSKDVTFRLASTTTEQVVLDPREHVAHSWLPYPQARLRLTFENARHVLDKAEAFLQARPA